MNPFHFHYLQNLAKLIFKSGSIHPVEVLIFSQKTNFEARKMLDFLIENSVLVRDSFENFKLHTATVISSAGLLFRTHIQH